MASVGPFAAVIITMALIFVGMLYFFIGWWVMLPIAFIVGIYATPMIREKLKERDEYYISEEELKQLKTKQRLQKDQAWYTYRAGTTCISCGGKKIEGSQLCDKCCPLCGQKKTKTALICKNCLKEIPRDDPLGLSQGGVASKRIIRGIINRSNIPLRIQNILEATDKGQEIKFGPDFDLNALKKVISEEMQEMQEEKEKERIEDL